CTMKRLHVVSLTTVVRTVKILAVHMNFNLDMVIDLMKCFVCLEKLYMKIQTDSPAGANFWRHKHRNFLTSQDIRLKTLVLGHYRGIQCRMLQMENRISRGAQLCVTQVLTMMFRAPLTSMIWIWLIRSHVDVESGPGSWLSYSCVSHLVFLPKLGPNDDGQSQLYYEDIIWGCSF
uniref:F-box/LRR-repeat protein 15/At3g58940/PEG3-like LRR domain-containing protein n=1 Tax=Aegilops tauschii subsp. strangulata TaxID=200361 RepID=A0A452ZJ63_AEGTS